MKLNRKQFLVFLVGLFGAKKAAEASGPILLEPKRSPLKAITYSTVSTRVVSAGDLWYEQTFTSRQGALEFEISEGDTILNFSDEARVGDLWEISSEDGHPEIIRVSEVSVERFSTSVKVQRGVMGTMPKSAPAGAGVLVLGSSSSLFTFAGSTRPRLYMKP